LPAEVAVARFPRKSMSEASPQVREEYFENEGTGVEVEDLDAVPGIDRPWNPADIRVSTRQFSLRNVLDIVQDGDLELAPDFQRNKVWKARQKSRLVESVLLQIPLPAFYFAEDASGLMRVVDGLQRLSTIHGFVHGGPDGFKLVDLEYLHPEEGKRFDELPPPWRRRILNSQIVVHVIDPTTPVSVKYDIFKRINTGGTPLNAQEVRHCMSKPRSRNFLRDCTALDKFDLATGGRFRNHIRMDDREVVLRFCAFYLYDVPGYRRVGSMDAFLEQTAAALDNPAEVSDGKLQELGAAFARAMANCYLVFGRHAFRKWTTHSSAQNPINRPLFETWSVVLAEYSQEDIESRREEIVTRAREAMSYDRPYIDSITTSTGDPRKVGLRFAKAAAIAEGRR
jgi:Protein of unknown function DUF262